MKVVVTSRESIKPSRQTPDHQRHLQQSFLDQINNRNVVPYIYYYTYPTPLGPNIKSTTQQTCDRLKKSLSDTLTIFYPLAGRLRDNLFIDCNDEGVPFSQSQVQSQLSVLLTNPINFEQLNNLLPVDQLDDAGEFLLLVQVNVFECGGIAISICFSHKIADGLSIVTFINSWAAIARGDDLGGKIVSPRFDMYTIFPPREFVEHNRNTGTTKEKTVAKRFVFGESAVSALKAKYGVGLEGERPPSRIEALTNFIWSRLVDSTQGEGKPGKSYLVLQAMNLRTRANPPLPDHYFGNLSRFAAFTPSVDGSINEGRGFLTQMRVVMRKIDSNYVKTLQEGNNIALNSSKGSGEAKFFSFASNFRFQQYEADFGLGKPVWVSFAVLPYKNSINFLPNRSGDGVEVWFFMLEEDLAKLEADKDFMSFVSPSMGAQVLLPSCL